MNDIIVHSANSVTLLGGGEGSASDVEAALALAPTCVAADGGAELAAHAGVSVTALIGDFDSVSADTLALTPPEARFHISEQNSTDFDKALRHIAAPVVLGVGFLGARLDHQLAALHVLAAHPDRPCVLLGAREIVFLCPKAFQVDMQAGEVVSLFPMGHVTGTSTGLRWAIDGLDFDPMRRTGTSNEATGPIELHMDAPAMIVMLPRAYLGPVMRLLESLPASAQWPVRAERYRVPTQS